jgi:hypothetical protein
MRSGEIVLVVGVDVMICPDCTSNILDDCLYCPKCGKPTPLSAERSVGNRRAAPKVASAPPAPIAAQTPVADTIVRSASPLPDSRKLNALLTQANLSRVRGNWTEAIDHCVAVLQADPANASAHALLGDIYAARGRREDAVQWYRMALEIHPNPVDEAKLARVEREIAQQETQQAKSGRRISLSPTALPPDGKGPVGTVALMGVSPRLWLRGITAAALAFLVVSGGILLGTHNRHTQDGKTGISQGDPNQTNSIAPEPGGLGALPPSRPGGPSIVPPGAAPNDIGPPHTGGTGLAPDSAMATRTVPTGVPDGRQPNGTAASGVKPSLNLPTAPVQGIRPITPSGNTLGFATLSGGMKLAKMSSVSATSEEVLVLSNPPTSSTQENFRQNAIRNVFRAARNAFATNEGAKEASIYIQTDLTEKGGSILMVAHVDRDSALRSDPDSDAPDSLLNHLSSVQWGP